MSYVLPLGPYHPALEEPVHVKLLTEGEIIKDSVGDRKVNWN